MHFHTIYFYKVLIFFTSIILFKTIINIVQFFLDIGFQPHQCLSSKLSTSLIWMILVTEKPKPFDFAGILSLKLSSRIIAIQMEQ